MGGSGKAGQGIERANDTQERPGAFRVIGAADSSDPLVLVVIQADMFDRFIGSDRLIAAFAPLAPRVAAIEIAFRK